MEIPLTYSNLPPPSAITPMAPFFSYALNLTHTNHDPVTIYTFLENKRTYMSTNYRFMSTTYLPHVTSTSTIVTCENHLLAIIYLMHNLFEPQSSRRD